MRALIRCGLIGATLLLLGCESVDSRIKERSTAFTGWSPMTQERIRRGELKVGDNFDMTYIALGEPDSVEVIPHEDGSTVAIWTYPEITQKLATEEIVGYEDHTEYDLATGQRIHYKVPNRQKVYHNTRSRGIQVLFRNGLITSVRWKHAPPAETPAPTKPD